MVLSIVVFFLFWAVVGICFAINDENEKKAYENKIKAKQEQWRRGSNILMQSGLVSSVGYAISRKECERIEREINGHIKTVGYRPENASQFFKDEVYLVENKSIRMGYSYILFNELGYSSISEEQGNSLMYALSLEEKWDLYDGVNCWGLKPNKKYWIPYIQRRIDAICSANNIKSLRKI